MFIIISLIFILFFSFSFLFPSFYVSELILSFLPYIIAISLLGLIISFVKFKKIKEQITLKKIFLSIILALFAIFFFVSSQKFNAFYHGPGFGSGSTDSGSLTILFANVHKDNQDYTGIMNLIQKNNPDMLMFVEFTDTLYNHLKDFLQTEYPYTNSTVRSKTFVGSMVFSKYPLTNKAENFPQGMRRYGYFSLPYQGQQIYFYLVHTSSPDSYAHFIMRNTQLDTFAQDIKNHASDRKYNNIVVVGDFNLTPWSSYYTTLSTDFSGEFVDDTQHIPFLFTRKLFQLPIFQAHIDHLWTTKSLILEKLQAVTMPGSDHKAFLFTIIL